MPGDFVTVINGVEVDDSDELVLEVGELPVGEVAIFEIVRYGEEMTLEVRIGERESEAQIANLNSRLFPGFSVFPLTDDLRSESDVPRGTDGVVVSSVENRTPGAAAGVRVGDVITAVAGRPVRDMVDFYRGINEGGSAVDIEVLRDGSSEELQLRR